MTQLLIVGGSDAGISAGLRARELGPDAQVTLVVADRFPNYSICGIPYYLSGEVQTPHDLAHRTNEEIAAAGIRLLLEHRAEGLDPDNHTLDVRNPDGQRTALAYDKLVLATGAVSAHPAIPGLDLPGVFFLRWMADTFAIERFLKTHQPRSVAIVGGGYIGMEMAEGLTRRRLKVTVIEYADTVLTTVDPELGERVRDELISQGVDVATGVGVGRIESAGATAGTGLRILGSGGFSRQADMVLVVVGARPSTELAVAAGIPTGVGGAIRVTRRMETVLPDIFAAGDCVETWLRLPNAYGYLPLGTTAHKQGRIAGENAVGGKREFAGSLGTQSVKIFDLVVARTGFNDTDAKRAGLVPLSVDIEAWDHKAYYPGARQMLIRVTGDRSSGRLLGAQIVGRHGTEVSKRIDVFAAALFHGMDVEALNDLDLSYTPPLSSPWDPIQMSAQQWVKQWSKHHDRTM